MVTNTKTPFTNVLYLDIETFSEIDLKSAGSYKYSEAVEIMLFSFAFEDGPVYVWDLTAGEPCPPLLWEKWNDPKVRKCFHNSMFDRTQINASGVLPVRPVHEYIDSMVWALSHGLPGGLDILCEIFRIDEALAKHKDGKKLVLLFCKPRPKNTTIRRATSATHPKEWAQFKAYAGGDIHAMRAVIQKMPRKNYPVSANERVLWQYDQLMNDRGIPIDRNLAAAAIRAAAQCKADLGAQTQAITTHDGVTHVDNATQRDAMLEYVLSFYGIDLPDMRAATLERRLEDPDIPEPVKDLLRIRLEASVTSVSKFKRLLTAVGSDGRLRGCIQFSGAMRTHRDAGRIFQPQNLARPTMKQDEINFLIEATLNNCLPVFAEKPMKALSNMLRGVIKAPPGRKFVVSDLSNIEGRGGAWLASEEWKLQAFRDFDAGTGWDLYVLAYAKSFAIDPADVTKDQRQVGKVLELAMLFGGGVGAFITFALAYRINLDDLAQAAWPHIPAHILNRAKSNYAWTVSKRRNTYNLAQKTWIVCEALKLAWREAHPMVVQFWDECENAAKNAIVQPGKEFKAGKHVTFSSEKNWLYAKMPSGTSLCYPSPRISEKGEINFLGVNQYTRKWQRIKTFSGKLMENLTQKLARDRCLCNIPEIEKAGYSVVLRVHDELVTECLDDDKYNAEELSYLLAKPQSWCLDYPTAAAGLAMKRYGKG